MEKKSSLVDFMWFLLLEKQEEYKNGLFATQAPFFKSPISHKPFAFEQSFIWYGKRGKSCTLIVVKVVCLYLLLLIYNSPTKTDRTFYLTVR